MRKKTRLPVLYSSDSSIALYENPICSELVKRGLDELEPQNAEGWFKKGEDFRFIGDNKNAIDCYIKALKFDPQHGSALFFEGYCLLHHICECFKDDPPNEHRACNEKATETYERLLALHGKIDRPSYAADYNNYACAKDRLGDIETAFKYYKKATETDPDDSLYWANLGRSHYDKKQFDDAKKMLEKSLLLKENNPTAYYNFGLLYDDLSEYEKMAKSFKKYLEYIDHDLTRNSNGIAFAEKRIAEVSKMTVRTVLP